MTGSGMAHAATAHSSPWGCVTQDDKREIAEAALNGDGAAQQARLSLADLRILFGLAVRAVRAT